MCKKINFVCNPRIIAYDIKNNPVEAIPINLDVFIASDLWTKRLQYEVCATDLFPVSILEIVMESNCFFYTVKMTYWDGVGVYQVEDVYDQRDNKRVEATREYIDL